MTHDDDLPLDPFPPVRLRPGPRARRPDGTWAIEVDTEVIPLNLDCPDEAEWCDVCLLPSAAGFRFRVLVCGVPVRTALTLTICRDCGATARRTS